MNNENKEIINVNDSEDLDLALLRMKKNVKYQARMAVVAIAATIVLCFSMTVAWYSNILHTSDLIFKTETWDFMFTGNVNIGNGENLLAAPGDSGFIPLTVSNTASEDENEVSAIGMSVNIDKTNMSMLKERVYFYVDHQLSVNQEIVEKQYLGTQDSYLYTILPGRTLTLSEDYSNDYPMKWEWVYDVVGYYVRGTMESNGTIKDPEYIRPIEFDPQKASYDLNKESKTYGQLLTVEGMNVDDFILENYLKKDGFIGAEVNKKGNYYKVLDDVYIYLCTYEQVNANNQIDSAFATASDVNSYVSKIVLTGVKANENSQYVMSSSQLAETINTDVNIIKLDGNMTLSDNVIVEEGTDVVVDLNGYTLNVQSTITANNGSSIGFVNGTIITEDDKKVFINIESSELYLDKVEMNGFYSAIVSKDNNSSEDSHIYIYQSKISTSDETILIYGNGDKSSRKSVLMIEESDLISEKYITIMANGTFANNGIDIKIIKSNITGYYSGIYQPAQNSNLYIKDSTISGITGIAIKGGNVDIENSKILGTGSPDQIEEPKYQKSGYTDVGSAIYVEDNYLFDNDTYITITINNVALTGSKTFVLSENADAIIVYANDSDRVSVIVNGGTYSSDVTKYLPNDGSKVIEQQADGTYVVE